MPISSSPQRLRGGVATLLLAAAVTAGVPAAARAQDGYVTLRGANAALVYDPADPNAVSDTVPLGGVPSDVAVSPDGSAAYVLVANTFVYRIVNGVRDAAPLTASLNGIPEQLTVSPDGTKLFIANAGNNSRVHAVSVADGALTHINFPAGAGLWGIDAVSTPLGDRVYVSSSVNNEVLVLDALSNGPLTAVAVGNGPQGVAASPLGDRVYVANYQDGSVSVIDTTSNATFTIAGVGNGPQELAVSGDGSRVYVTLKGDGDVAVIDATTNTVVDTVDLGNAADSLHGISFSADGALVVVAHFGGQRLSVIDPADGNSFASTAPIASSQPRYVAFQPLAPVLPPDLPPVFNLPLCDVTLDAVLDAELAVPVSAVDDNGVLVTVSESPATGGILEPPLPGARVSTVESIWRWTPTGDDAGDYQLTFTADDGINAPLSCTVTVRVPEPPAPPDPPEPPAPDRTEFRAFYLTLAKVNRRGHHADTFWLNGSFATDLAAGDDISPAEEEVIIAIEGTSWTLPAGAFRSKLRGRVFRFHGKIGNTRLQVLITRLGRRGSGRYNINVTGWTEALAAVDNPLQMCVTVGNDFGCAAKRGWIR